MNYLNKLKEANPELLDEIEELGLVIAVDNIGRHHLINTRKVSYDGSKYYISPSAVKLHKEQGKTDDDIYSFFVNWVNEVISSYKMV